jgi:hypothetical protein
MRRALQMMEAEGHETLDSLIESLLDRPVRESPVQSTGVSLSDSVSQLMGLPQPLQVSFAEPAFEPRGSLQFLTNRLSPLKVATRVLAGMASEESWPKIEEFHARASAVAREVGFRLRADDQRFGRRGAIRRWVGYPVGDDAAGSMRRFVFSFTLEVNQDEVSGPMWLLGLANRVGDRVALTEAGWRLAAAPSPILDGGEGTFGELEAAIVRKQIAVAPDELRAAAEFLEVVRRSGGVQGRLDGLLGARHPDWTANRTIAERGALLGRLGDLGLIAVQGRGAGARIEVGPHAPELENLRPREVSA